MRPLRGSGPQVGKQLKTSGFHQIFAPWCVQGPAEGSRHVITDLTLCVFRLDFDYLNDLPVLILDVDDDFKNDRIKQAEIIDKVCFYFT